MDKLNIDLNIISNLPHTSNIISGYILLSEQKKINLNINIIEYNNSIYPHNGLVEAIINKKTKVAYDVLDGYNMNLEKVDKYLENVDFYFKRSFNKEENKKMCNENKIYPLGMNYHATTKNNPLDHKKTILKIKDVLRRILGKNVEKIYNISDFEYTPTYKKENLPNVLFCTRLWSPEGELFESQISTKSKKERIHINKMRVEIIKRLKNELGSNFIGGLYNSKYAQENYPELILDESITQKENYLNLVKNCDICIGSLGLHKSTGWKTAEYVAASKAIVNENLFYESLGDFENGKNYLGFKDENECIEHIYELIKNPDKIVKMQNDNYIYYNKFLRPDMQVLNTLLMVMNN